MRCVARVPRLLFWALFTTLLISSSGLFCERKGETRLTSLELEVQGVNRISFDPLLRVYDVWLPSEATTATVRAETMDPEARVNWYVPDGAGTIAAGAIGVGGGVVTVDLPLDGQSLFVAVLPPGASSDTYVVTINPVCPQADLCHNGGVPGTCTGGVCVASCVPSGTEVCDDGLDNDCDGLVDSEDDDCITVEAGGDQVVGEGDSVEFSGEVRGADEYQWDFGDGTAAETGTLTPTHVYADDGAYDVTLTMTTSGGVSYSDTLLVTVQNVTPTLVAGLDVSGNEVTVVGTFNDPGTLDTHIAWIDWGDGQGSAGTVTESPFGPPGAAVGMNGTVTGSHVYTNDGTYTVTVTVEDDDADVVANTVVVDVGCVGAIDEICDDGLDNDCDGLVDGDDSDCAPAVVCPCFTLEDLDFNRDTWNPSGSCWAGGATAPGGVRLMGTGAGYSTEAAAYRRSDGTVPNDAYCYKQLCGLDGHCVYTLSGWGTPPGAGQVQITEEEWNACLALVEAEVANAGLTCFECNHWSECDPNGTVNCTGGFCVPK